MHPTGYLKRPRDSPHSIDEGGSQANPFDDESTEIKLARLASLHPELDHQLLLDILLEHEGSVERAEMTLAKPLHKKRSQNAPTVQTSLSSFAPSSAVQQASPMRAAKSLTKKGRTLHLYAPEDVAANSPCSILHNFLPSKDADLLLKELLSEAPTFERQTFKLFDRVVQSPHSACFYVGGSDEQREQKTQYVYNGSYITDVRRLTPQMKKVSSLVQAAVNNEVSIRIKTHYPGEKKLKHQSPKEWIPNAAFVNCYDNGSESVGYHADQLTYLGPRAIIGSLSLGVTREFRVRKVTPSGDNEVSKTEGKPGDESQAQADAQGQISIHLPHNSLLVMHAEMQEEYKHSISPASTIEPHPVAGNKRINVTYRYYRETFHPRHTPRCACDVPAVLRSVQRKKDSLGRYFWMCHSGSKPDGKGCTFFQWAEFDDDGEPVKS